MYDEDTIKFNISYHVRRRVHKIPDYEFNVICRFIYECYKRYNTNLYVLIRNVTKYYNSNNLKELLSSSYTKFIN